MAKKVDFKQIMLQKGERVGLIVAGVLMVLLVATSLFLPNKGLFAGSSTEKAKVLDDSANWVSQKLTDPNNVPGESDKPPKDAKKSLEALVKGGGLTLKHGDVVLNDLVPPTGSGEL